MTLNFLTGLIGSIILVAGAALPDNKVRHPIHSIKNWFFALGSLIMLLYSILNYLTDGAPIFFIMLELLISASCFFMMCNVSEKTSDIIIILLSVALIGWSLVLFKGDKTIIFIIGLAAIAIGYVAKAGTFHRELALFLGSALIALFSYLTETWVFFWLNTFFAMFSAWYAWRALR